MVAGQFKPSRKNLEPGNFLKQHEGGAEKRFFCNRQGVKIFQKHASVKTFIYSYVIIILNKFLENGNAALRLNARCKNGEKEKGFLKEVLRSQERTKELNLHRKAAQAGRPQGSNQGLHGDKIEGKRTQEQGQNIHSPCLPGIKEKGKPPGIKQGFLAASTGVEACCKESKSGKNKDSQINN